MSNNMTITKEKISEELKKHSGLSSLICKDITDLFFQNVFNLTKEDGKLNLPNFGTFCISSKNERPGFNVKTGEEVKIPARTVFKFLPSRSFKEKIN